MLIEHGKTKFDTYYIVMSLEGEASSYLKMKFKNNYAHNKIISLCMQTLDWLASMHSTGYLHCDVKPENVLYQAPLEDSCQCDEKGFGRFTLIDYGISKPYIDENGEHIKKHEVDDFEGTAEFISTDLLNKTCKYRIMLIYLLDPSRKHDLESLLYTLIFLLKWEAPYGQLDSAYATENMRVYHQVMNRKKYIKLAQREGISLGEYLLSERLHISNEITTMEHISTVNHSLIEFADYILNLDYYDAPDYEFLHRW